MLKFLNDNLEFFLIPLMILGVATFLYGILAKNSYPLFSNKDKFEVIEKFIDFIKSILIISSVLVGAYFVVNTDILGNLIKKRIILDLRVKDVKTDELIPNLELFAITPSGEIKLETAFDSLSYFKEIVISRNTQNVKIRIDNVPEKYIQITHNLILDTNDRILKDTLILPLALRRRSSTKNLFPNIAGGDNVGDSLILKKSFSGQWEIERGGKFTISNNNDTILHIKQVDELNEVKTYEISLNQISIIIPLGKKMKLEIDNNMKAISLNEHLK